MYKLYEKYVLIITAFGLWTCGRMGAIIVSVK